MSFITGKDVEDAKKVLKERKRNWEKDEIGVKYDLA